jgi:hypothetical protein
MLVEVISSSLPLKASSLIRGAHVVFSPAHPPQRWMLYWWQQYLLHLILKPIRSQKRREISVKSAFRSGY